jgi:hypothetical protein
MDVNFPHTPQDTNFSVKSRTTEPMLTNLYSTKETSSLECGIYLKMQKQWRTTYLHAYNSAADRRPDERGRDAFAYIHIAKRSLA